MWLSTKRAFEKCAIDRMHAAACMRSAGASQSALLKAADHRKRDTLDATGHHARQHEEDFHVTAPSIR